MIDLSRSREDLLASIGASADLLERGPVDPTSPQLDGLDEAHFEIRAHTRDEILPLVRGVLRRRFDWVSEGRLVHDLLLPLKRGLGNAFKRGNVADPGKWIRAQIALTRSGVLVEIHDEGNGFDVERVLTRFRGAERYFTNGGAGFDTLERSTASVSYADGGRTLLIAYACPQEERADALASAADERFMSGVLQVGLPMLKKRRGVLESLQIVEAGTPPCRRRRELGYSLRYREPGSDRSRELWLTGRILEADRARTDCAVARVLAKGPFRRERAVRVPEPLSAFKGQPQMVFYRLRRALDFGRCLARRSPRERLQAVARIAEGLRTWHHCGLKPVCIRPLEEWLTGRERALADLVRDLDGRQPEAGRALRTLTEQLARRVRELRREERMPVHGRFDWDCILGEGDVLFFYEFEHACSAHPGLDLGGFLADLRFRGDLFGSGFAADAERGFLSAYGAIGWDADLEFFVAHAALMRLADCPPDEIDGWLAVAREAA